MLAMRWCVPCAVLCGVLFRRRRGSRARVRTESVFGGGAALQHARMNPFCAAVRFYGFVLSCRSIGPSEPNRKQANKVAPSRYTIYAGDNRHADTRRKVRVA